MLVGRSKRSKICMESLDSKLDADLMTTRWESCLEDMAADPCRSRAIFEIESVTEAFTRCNSYTSFVELTIHAKHAFWSPK